MFSLSSRNIVLQDLQVVKDHGVVERLEKETRSSPTTTDLKSLTAKPASNQDRELGFEPSSLLLSGRFSGAKDTEPEEGSRTG